MTDLSLKYRPRKFADLAQPAVVRAITNAIAEDRLSQFYLFEGSRGCGKTSLARLIAMRSVCEDPEGVEPCGKCDQCRDVAEGRFFSDVIEVNAARHTGKDEIADLVQSTVHTMPMCSAKKVYILDECHKLSDSAQSSLLKVLEEPPAHVIFIFCTTELRKVLDAIVDRSLHFRFRPIPADVIAGRLEEICRAEGIRFEEGTLEALGREARGSLRQALKLLQTIADGGAITMAGVEGVLGQSVVTAAIDVLEKVAEGDRRECINLVDAMAREGRDLSMLLWEMCSCLMDALRIKVIRGDRWRSTNRTEADWARLKELSGLSAGCLTAAADVVEAGLRRLNQSAAPPELVATLTVIEAVDAMQGAG